MARNKQISINHNKCKNKMFHILVAMVKNGIRLKKCSALSGRL